MGIIKRFLGLEPTCDVWKECSYYEEISQTCNYDGGEDYCGVYKENKNGS